MTIWDSFEIDITHFSMCARKLIADVVELVYTIDLGSIDACHKGSSPFICIDNYIHCCHQFFVLLLTLHDSLIVYVVIFSERKWLYEKSHFIFFDVWKCRYLVVYTAKGQTVNADVNAALNILRKSNLTDLTVLQARGAVNMPLRIRISWKIKLLIKKIVWKL